MSLSLKTSALVVFSGNANGGTLSMQLPDIGYTGLSFGSLSPPMTKGFQTAQGTLSYISADRLQSDFAFTTSTYDSGVLKMFFTVGGVIIGVLTATDAEFTPDFVPTATTVNFNPSTSAPSTAEILRGIQKLGGSEGYQKHLVSQASNAVALTNTFSDLSLSSVSDEWRSIAIKLHFGSALVYAWLNISTVDGHKGEGGCWGAGIGGGAAVGVLKYVNWNKLMSAENRFNILNVAGGVIIKFSINDEDVAQVYAYGPTLGALYGLAGTFNWSNA